MKIFRKKASDFPWIIPTKAESLDIMCVIGFPPFIARYEFKK